MWHFSMQGLPACNVAIISRELLPHVFTLTVCPPAIGRVTDRGYFLWHCLLPGDLILDKITRYPALHRCIALCCPDFPPFRRSRNAITRLVANGKNNSFAGVIYCIGSL